MKSEQIFNVLHGSFKDYERYVKCKECSFLLGVLDCSSFNIFIINWSSEPSVLHEIA